MKKVRKYSKCMLWFFACLILTTVKGCGDNQSNKAIYVEGFSVKLHYQPSENPAAPDIWNVSGDEEGRDITRIGHGFVLQLTDDEGNPYADPGIRVDVEVVGHGSIAGFGDIWERESPGGSPYGFLVCSPEEGSGMYDGVLHGRTNGKGRLLICAGLGDPFGAFDPDDPLDYDYELPGPGGGYSDVFDTWVELKITIPKKLPLSPVYVWATFVRAQYQNMWSPSGGVYGNSRSGLGHWPYGSMGIQSDSFKSETFEIPKIKKATKYSKEKYPLIGSREKVITMEASVESEPSLKSLVLTQLRWDPDYGWAYFYIQTGEELHAIWTDPNDPNEIEDILSASEPYAYFAEVTLAQPFDGNSAISTVHLRAMEMDIVKSKIPYPMYLYDKSPDNMTLTFMGWFVISEDPDFQGQYQDEWGNPYTVIYMPELTYPDIDFPDPFGDFNADDEVDYHDLEAFSWHWLDSTEDDNTAYDAMYEEPNSWDGLINFQDFSAFGKNWLK